MSVSAGDPPGVPMSLYSSATFEFPSQRPIAVLSQKMLLTTAQLQVLLPLKTRPPMPCGSVVVFSETVFPAIVAPAPCTIRTPALEPLSALLPTMRLLPRAGRRRSRCCDGRVDATRGVDGVVVADDDVVDRGDLAAHAFEIESGAGARAFAVLDRDPVHFERTAMAVQLQHGRCMPAVDHRERRIAEPVDAAGIVAADDAQGARRVEAAHANRNGARIHLGASG